MDIRIILKQVSQLFLICLVAGQTKTFHILLSAYLFQNSSACTRYRIYMSVFPGTSGLPREKYERKSKQEEHCFEKQFLSTNAAVNIFLNTLLTAVGYVDAGLVILVQYFRVNLTSLYFISCLFLLSLFRPRLVKYTMQQSIIIVQDINVSFDDDRDIKYSVLLNLLFKTSLLNMCK